MKIAIKGPIISSSDQWIYDWFGMEATSPKKVLDQLSEANGADVEIEINSGGGSVFAASEIYTALKEHSGKTTGKIVGLAASAASVIAMATDRLLMAPTAQMMIHNASSFAQGDYRDMDHTSDMLKNTNQTIANAYSFKSGKSYNELLEMMDKETWLTPQQALDHNLIDEIMFNQSFEVTASANITMLPDEVINKIRNELKANREIEPIAQAGKTKNKEGVKKMDLNQLKNDFPNLYEQVKNEGFASGVKSERDRIKSLEDLEISGSETIVNKAKFETGITAEQAAIEIIKAQKEKASNHYKQVLDDAQQIPAIDGVVDEPEDDDKKQQENVIQNMINAAKRMRGVN